jgi:hypothetical protein
MRQRLPNRRSCEGLEIEALGLRFHATIGRYSNGAVGEVFLNNHRANSMAGILASDAAVLASLLLQEGYTPRQLLHSLMKDSAGRATSPIGVVLEAILAEEQST